MQDTVGTNEGWRWRRSRLVLGGAALAVVATTTIVQPTGAPTAFADEDAEIGPAETDTMIRMVVQARRGLDPIPAIEAVGGTVRRSFPGKRAAVADMTRAEARQLRMDETLRTVKPLRKKVKGDPTDAVEHDPWRSEGQSGDTTIHPEYLADVADEIGTDNLVSWGKDGEGIDVALIDTGVAPVTGLDTADAVINGPDLSFDYQGGAPAGYDAFGHGTHLASIIASRDPDNKGIAPKSRILNMKVGAYDGSVDVTQVIAAIDWVVQNRNQNGLNVRVINLAYGVDALQSYQVDPLAHAVESAWRNGIVVVVSAGNSGAALNNPAIDPFVLTVGAADLGDANSGGDDKLADFSSVGTTARSVDVLAPGVSVVGARNPNSYIDLEYPTAREGSRWFRGSGTSQAAAVVSGVVADMLEARSTLTPNQVKYLLRAKADLIDSDAATGQGKGMVDADSSTYGLILGSTSQGTTYSTGTGSLDLARGGYYVTAPDGVDLRGEQDIFGSAWTPTVWGPKSTSGTAWTGGTWNGNEWTGTDWAATTDPEFTLWAGRTWKGRTWRGSTWRGSTWEDATWEGRTWRELAWEGRTWRAAGWEGSTWRDAGWEGSTWRGSTWRGSTWRGSTWRAG